MGEINYDGLAELGWRGSQWINGMNGYRHWKRLSLSEQAELQSRWTTLTIEERAQFCDIVIAAIDAYQSAVLV